MSILDEQVLSQRLHEDLGALAAPPPPVGTVLHRGRAIRARRWAAAAAGLMAGVAAVAIVVSAQPGSPAARPAAARAGSATRSPGPAGPPPPGGSLNAAAPTGGTVFAAGTAGGAAWQLSLRNVAGHGSSCLPAVMLNGTDGDLLSTAASPTNGITSSAFLNHAPGHPGAGYAALQVAPAVTHLTAIFRNGTTLTVHPVPLRACGRQLHLAGFAYPLSGVAQITAYSGGQFASTARETPPASMFGGAGDSGGSATGPPALRLVPGVWEHLGATPPDTASGTIGSGGSGAGRWRVTVTLGAAGECFAGSSFGAGSYTSGTACQPIGRPPATVMLRPLVFAAQPRLAGYGGLVSPRAATVMAALSSGTTERISPVTVGGRSYLALALPSGTTLSRLTLLDRSGHAFATVTSIPPAG
ncbi:MAG: hypothetical protein QOG05_5148 [Streptosporangiaceae bacterium]|nr:hypothetical protein [Streptosporangiaceae bacterium]